MGPRDLRPPTSGPSRRRRPLRLRGIRDPPIARGFFRSSFPVQRPRAALQSVLRRQRWTNKLLVVAAGDLFELLFVEELLIGGRQPQGPGRLPALPEEPLNTRWPEEQEQAGFRRIDMERVRDVARAIDDRASDRFDHGLTVLDSNLAERTTKNSFSGSPVRSTCRARQMSCMHLSGDWHPPLESVTHQLLGTSP
jgi:hypothetical protein